MKKTSAFVLLVAVLFGVVESTKWYELNGYTFEDYVQEFGKLYDTKLDEKTRKSIFIQNMEEIRLHNSKESSWKLGVNQFTDRTTEERKRLLGYVISMSTINNEKVDKSKYNLSAYPKSRDWREAKIISSVKNQGDCGSCWTFATAETVESYWANKTGQLNVLSEQQILDCTPNPKHCGGTGGCQGGTAELAMARIVEMGGLSSEWTYPYQSFRGSNYKCHFDSNTPGVAKLKSYVKLPTNAYEPLLAHVAEVGPLAISVDASSWFAYESGVYDGCNQTSPEIDHAVQLVGYGETKDGEEYWLVRNSWSPTWGEDGYIKLKRMPNSMRCGEDTHPLDGDGCSGGPKEVKVCGTCGILYDNAYPIVA